MKRILVVEDNANLAYGLCTSLELEGHEVLVAEDGHEGLRRAREVDPDLVVLDLMLPGMDGYRVLKALREEGRTVPVLILTARGEEADKVLGFRLGADDYVTKPFGLLELLARVQALLRRSGGRWADDAQPPVPVERFGRVELNPASRQVLRAGEPVTLTPKEFDLLHALVRRRGRVASRLELLSEVWGHRAAVMTRTVDMHVVELRKKLEDDPSAPRHIVTVWKAGYRLDA
jgi:two-component system alkaline phosphatase synthesis response regulator PhoP